MPYNSSLNEYTDWKWSFSCVYPGIRATKSRERITANKTKLRSIFRVSAYPRIGITKSQPKRSSLTRNPKPETMMASTAWRTTPCFHRLIPFLISLTPNDYIQSFGVAVSAFAPSQPTGNVILRKSSRGTSTNLYSLLDSLGGIFSGPKLEAEKYLPYDPPFSSELSIADDVRTFAIKERP